jgi:HSP20 family protein
MASFFEKLKKGMDIDEPAEEETEEKEESSPSVESPSKEETKKKSKKPKTRKKESKVPKEDKVPEIKTRKIEIQSAIIEEEMEEKSSVTALPAEKTEEEKPVKKEKKWPSLDKDEEGQLAVDIFQTENDLVIQSAIAGVKPEDLDISIERDIISIRGNREKPSEEGGDYFCQECFWGSFSREIIVPVEADPQRAAAEMKNGVLTIRIPKILKEKKKKILIKG